MLKQMNDKDYFSIPAVSNSFLVRSSKSLAHAEIPITPTPAMKLGTMIHKYFLEQEEFAETYILELPIDKRTKKYKDFKEENTEKVLYSMQDKAMLEGIENTMASYHLANDNPFDENKNTLPDINIRDIIRDSETEVAGFWEHEGVACKMKIDAIYNKTLLIDLKKTYDIEQFKWSVKKYQYHRQAAFYLSGYKAITSIDAEFIFLAVESSAPYGVKAFQLSDTLLKQGKTENNLALWAYKNRSQKKDNKVYTDGVETL